MNKYQKFLAPVGILAAGFVSFLLMSALKTAPKVSPAIDKTPLVETHTVQVTPYRLNIASQGITSPLNRTPLSAQVGGLVVAFSDAFNTGGMVKKGEILVEIEELDYLSALKTARANLARAEASFAEEEARSEVAADEWSRERGNTEAPLLGLRIPQLAREKANVLSAQSELEKAKKNLNRTRIRAPFDAIVSKRLVNLGQLVSVGSSLGELLATAKAEIRLPISLDDFYLLGLTDLYAVSISIQANINEHVYQWPAEIIREERVVDTNNRMLFLHVHVDDPYHFKKDDFRQRKVLRFGTFVSATIKGKTINNAIKLPKTSLIREKYVFIVDQQKRLQKKNVKLIGEQDAFVIVEAELKSGDHVLSSRLPQAISGMKVKIRSAEKSDGTH